MTTTREVIFSGLSVTFGSGQAAVTTQDISDVRISRSISGMGLSGICITSLSFQTMYDMALVGTAELTKANGLGSLPDFYIDRRSKRNGVWTVDCCCRAAFLDTPIDGISKISGKYQTSSVIDRMKLVCGLDTVQLPSSFPSQLEPDSIDGKTYQSFLQEVSEAYTGFFYITSGRSLNFFSPPNGTYTEDCAPTEYSSPAVGADFTYGTVSVSNGRESGKVGSSLPVLEINNDFALADSQSIGYYITVTSFSMTDFSVRIVYNTILTPFSRILIDSVYYLITSVSARVVGGEIWQDVSAALPQTGEISRKGAMQRRLDDMVSTNRTYGTIKTAYQNFMAVSNQSGV